MTEKLHLAPRPCATCPYRTDTPPGIWDATEYDKLARYDGIDPTDLELATFLCHQTAATGVDTACKGWVACHQDGLAVRVAMIRGDLTAEQVYSDCPVEIYSSGAEAREAGLAGIEAPSTKARVMIAKLVDRGIGHDPSDEA